MGNHDCSNQRTARSNQRGVLECRKALEQAHGDMDKAAAILKKRDWPKRLKNPNAPPKTAASSSMLTRATAWA